MNLGLLVEGHGEVEAAKILVRRVAESLGLGVRHARVGVVLAVREYEAWFLAAAASLRGRRGLPADLESLPGSETEAVRDAKGRSGGPDAPRATARRPTSRR